MNRVIIVLFCTMLLSVTARSQPFGMKDTGPPGTEQVSNHDQTDVTTIDLPGLIIEQPVVFGETALPERSQETLFIVTNERKELTRQTTHEVHNKGSSLLLTDALSCRELPATDQTGYPLRC